MNGLELYTDYCLVLKNDIEIEDLKKYGFNEDGIITRLARDGRIMYALRVDSKRRLLILTDRSTIIVGGVQALLFDLISDGIVEKVKREDINNINIIC